MRSQRLYLSSAVLAIILLSACGCSNNSSSSLVGTDAAKLPVASPSLIEQATAENYARHGKWVKNAPPAPTHP